MSVEHNSDKLPSSCQFEETLTKQFDQNPREESKVVKARKEESEKNQKKRSDEKLKETIGKEKTTDKGPAKETSSPGKEDKGQD
jgi:hypothetical protein